MTPSERAHIRRRRRVIAAGVLVAGTAITTVHDEQPTIVPAAAASPGPRDDVAVRERLLPKAPTVHRRRPAPPQPARISTALVVRIPGAWARLVQCEAHGDWRYGAPGHPGDPGYREYEGGPNFVHSTWLRYGGGEFAAHAYDATPLQQILIARRTLRAEGVGAWPVCGPKAGLTLRDAA